MGRAGLWWKSVRGWRRAIYHSHSLAIPPLSLHQVSSLVFSPLGRRWFPCSVLLHHLSTPLGGRTTGRAKLAARGFPIFHREVGFKHLCPLSLSHRPFLLAAPPWNKTTATENWCFSLQIRPIFHRVPPHRATCLGGPTYVPAANKGFLSLSFSLYFSFSLLFLPSVLFLLCPPTGSSSSMARLVRANKSLDARCAEPFCFYK